MGKLKISNEELNDEIYEFRDQVDDLKNQIGDEDILPPNDEIEVGSAKFGKEGVFGRPSKCMSPSNIKIKMPGAGEDDSLSTNEPTRRETTNPLD